MEGLRITKRERERVKWEVDMRGEKKDRLSDDKKKSTGRGPRSNLRGNHCSPRSADCSWPNAGIIGRVPRSWIYFVGYNETIRMCVSACRSMETRIGEINCNHRTSPRISLLVTIRALFSIRPDQIFLLSKNDQRYVPTFSHKIRSEKKKVE